MEELVHEKFLTVEILLRQNFLREQFLVPLEDDPRVRELRLVLRLLRLGLLACAACGALFAADAKPSSDKTMPDAPKLEKATFGAGCFWGVEYQYAKIPGVLSAVCGYACGKTENPTYEDVCSHTTGHAEVIDMSGAVAHWKTAGLDLSPILHVPEFDEATQDRHCTKSQDHGLDRALDVLPVCLSGDMQTAMLKLHTVPKAAKAAAPRAPE
mgnify:CR=1 FL=1